MGNIVRSAEVNEVRNIVREKWNYLDYPVREEWLSDVSIHDPELALSQFNNLPKKIQEELVESYICDEYAKYDIDYIAEMPERYVI